MRRSTAESLSAATREIEDVTADALTLATRVVDGRVRVAGQVFQEARTYLFHDRSALSVAEDGPDTIIVVSACAPRLIEH